MKKIKTMSSQLTHNKVYPAPPLIFFRLSIEFITYTHKLNYVTSHVLAFSGQGALSQQVNFQKNFIIPVHLHLGKAPSCTWMLDFMVRT